MTNQMFCIALLAAAAALPSVAQMPSHHDRRSLKVADTVASAADNSVLTAVATASTTTTTPAPAATAPATTAVTPAATAQPEVTIADFSQNTATSDVLHIVSGRSIFVNTKARLRRVYIANPAILDSYMANPNQVVITAKTPGVCSLILWDEKGKAQAYQVSSDFDVQALAGAMHQAFPRESVDVHSSENRIMLSGTVSTEAVSDAAAKLAAIYAKDVSNALVVDRALIKQVRLQVRIIEVDRSKLNQFGVNFFQQGGQVISNTTTSQFQTNPVYSPPSTSTGVGSLLTGDPLNFLLFSSKLNIGASIKDMENKQLLQILAEPSITSLNGQKAQFLAGGEFPFPVVQGGAGGQTSISISFRPYGVKLEFTPFVNADGSIELKVAPEVSALDYSNAVTISGYTIPALSSRKAETQVTLKDGQSFAISGLLDRRTTDLLGKTPGISSIPIIGQLFKSKGITHSTSELIVIVTPTVVNPLAENPPPVQAEPKQVIPMMSTEEFDKQFTQGKKKK